MLGTRRDRVVARRSMMGDQRIRLTCLALALLAGLVARAPAARAATGAFDSALASNQFVPQSNVFAPAGTPSRYEAAILADHPTVYYRFNETAGSTAFDSSGHGLDATYAGGVTLGNAGALVDEADTAAFAEGVVATQSGDMLPSGSAPRTLEAWVHNITAPFTLFKYGDVAHKHGFEVGFDELRGGTLDVTAGEKSITVQGYGSENHSGWHLVDVTYDGKTTNIYLDGS